MAPPQDVESEADSTILPLRATGSVDEQGNQPHQYWSLATANLFNWRREHARFSDKPKELIGFLDTILFTHQSTCDVCQQLLQILFTTGERGCIILEAQKNVPGSSGPPTQNQADIDKGVSSQESSLGL